jgi:hypothetical protein
MRYRNAIARRIRNQIENGKKKTSKWMRRNAISGESKSDRRNDFCTDSDE